MPVITSEEAKDAQAVEALIAHAFGPGRFAKTAERLREGNTPLTGASVVARMGEHIVGCARMWPIHVGAAPAVLLGPFAVADDCRSNGLGATLVEAACQAAKVAGHGLVLLVGDQAYFAPLGFMPAPDVRLPGPVDQRRVLVRALTDGAAEGLSGAVTR